MKFIVVATMTLLSVMPLFAKTPKEKSFWNWFASNERELFSFEKNQEKVFDSLSKELEKVDGNLTFEFGPVLESGKREFVISAAGIRESFPAVEALHAAAPELKNWVFVKFRPRRNPINDLEFAKKKVNATDVHYAIFKDEDPKKVGIMLFFDGYNEDEDSTWGQIGYLFLDEALGEFDVETHVGEIVFFDRTSKYYEHAKPLAGLATHFDERIGR